MEWQNERGKLKNLENISQEAFEQLERYVLGQMGEAEKQALEQQMQADPVLQAQCREVSQLILGIEQAVFRDSLEKYHQEMGQGEATRVVPMFSRYRMVVAAGLAVVLAALGWIVFQPKDPYARLYADFYVEDPGLITAMSSEGEYAFDRAMVDYKMGNYAEAIAQWENLLLARPASDTLLYFLGSAHMANGELQLAMPYFQKVAAQPQGSFSQESYWYLGLAYLKLGEPDAAREALRQSGRPEAEKLLKSITTP